MAGTLFERMHDKISEGVDKALGEGVAAEPTPSPSPTPTPAAAAPVAAPAAAPEEVDEFEFAEDKPTDPTTPAAGGAEGTAPAPGETPAVPAATPAAEADDEAVDWSKMLPAEVEQAYLRTNRGKQMLQRFKEMRELAKDTSEGGLGFIPNVQQIKQFYEDSSGFETMTYDFRSGNPERMSNWANYWFEPSKNPAEFRSQQAMASQLPEMMRNLNPQAYAAFARTLVGDHLVNELLDKARTQTDPSERAFFARFARSIHEYVNGESGAPDITDLTGDPRPAPPDPKVLELQTQISRRDQQDSQRRTQALEQRKRTNTSKLSSDQRNRYDTLLGQALAPIKERLEKTVFYPPTVDNFIKEVDNVVRKSPGWGRYEMLEEQAVMAGTPEAMKAANDQYFLLAKPVIKNLRTKYLRDAGALLSQQNSATHSTHQNGAVNGALPGGGAPVEAVGTPGKPARLPGENIQEWLERVSKLTAV